MEESKNQIRANCGRIKGEESLLGGESFTKVDLCNPVWVLGGQISECYFYLLFVFPSGALGLGVSGDLG